MYIDGHIINYTYLIIIQPAIPLQLSFSRVLKLIITLLCSFWEIKCQILITSESVQFFSQ